MIKDKVKTYKMLGDFQNKCYISGAKNSRFASESHKIHLSHDCSKIHYIPNKDFLYKKLNYSCDQERALINRRNSRYKTLKKLSATQFSAQKKMNNDESTLINSSLIDEETPKLKMPGFKAGERMKTKIEVNIIFTLFYAIFMLFLKVDGQNDGNFQGEIEKFTEKMSESEEEDEEIVLAGKNENNFIVILLEF